MRLRAAVAWMGAVMAAVLSGEGSGGSGGARGASAMPTICDDTEAVVRLLRPGTAVTAKERSAAEAAGARVPESGAGADAWLPLEAIQQHIRTQKKGFVEPRRAMFACVEGYEQSVDDNDRMYDAGDVLTVLGGDLAEYLLALNVYRHHFNGTRGDTLDSAVDLFAEYLRSTPERRTFYFHSTAAATRAMYEALGLDIDEDLDDPFGLAVPQDFNKPKLLAAVIDPRFVGCEHLRQILLHPTEYHTPRGLTERVIQSAFRYLWTGNRLSDANMRDIQFELLDADFRGSAVLHVVNNVTAGPCSVREHFYPLIPPRLNWWPHDDAHNGAEGPGQPKQRKTQPYQLYIQYPQSAVHRRRHNMAKFFVAQPMGAAPPRRHHPSPQAVPLNVFHQHMDRLAREQHELTLRTITAGLPVYEVTFVPASQAAIVARSSWTVLQIASVAMLVLLALLFVAGAIAMRARRSAEPEAQPLVRRASQSAVRVAVEPAAGRA